MKTPEEMAKEYTLNLLGLDLQTQSSAFESVRDFLAGYKAAKDEVFELTEMLEEHLDDICKAGLSEEETDSLLHKPSYVLNMLGVSNEQHRIEKTKKS